MPSSELYSVEKLTAEARRLAADYRRATGKTLPLSSEIAVNDARRLLGLDEPTAADGLCDAVRRDTERGARIQIKGRVQFNTEKGAGRIGQLKLDQDWDEILLVLMDQEYEPQEIYGARRAEIEAVLADKPHNKRGAMSVAQFKIVATQLWCVEERSGDPAS